MTRTRATLLALAAPLLIAFVARAEEPQPPPIPPQVFPEPISEDETGFETIFDGKTLEGWDGNPLYWRVENGAIVGETTEPNLPKYNSSIIWRGGKVANFELKLDYRISDRGNSGIQYRNIELPRPKWVLLGSQMDIDGAGWGRGFYESFGKARGMQCNRVTGQNYEERGRTFLALVGQFSVIPPGKTQRVIATLADCATITRALNDDWNHAHLIVRGNSMIHIVNGQLMSMVLDEDRKSLGHKGLLAMQVHMGPPMKVEFRNIRVKTL